MENLSAIRREKAYLRIVDTIVRIIAEGKVEYNDKFYSEPELMAMLGVSRPTLREALRVLEFLDIISVSPRKGISIKAPDNTSGYLPLLYMLAFEKTTERELFELREAMQLEMTASAAKNRTEDDLAALENILDEMEKNLGSTNEIFFDLDHRFHLRIVEAAGNSLILKLMHTMSPILQNQLLRQGSKVAAKDRKRTLDEHRSVLKCILEKDDIGAKSTMEQHLVRSRQGVQLEADRFIQIM